ncbi:MAG: molybdenum cofactor biosynthesis protein MoaE [Bacteroidota bacterium]
MKQEIKNHFINGPISSDFIADAIKKHQVNTAIGAFDIFLGQVRQDEIDGKVVTGIEFSAYEEMANKELIKLKEESLEKFDLIEAHIYHSLGSIPTGEVCFFVFTSSGHRPAAFAATQHMVNEIKKRVPIFGKEMLEDNTHEWKVNR